MTSEARDASADQGSPLKLFVFTRSTKTWRYTDADRLIFYNGDAYAPGQGIAHSKIQDGGEKNKVSIKITLPKTLKVADNWRPYPPSDPVAVTIMTQHFGEADFLADWVGRIVGPQYGDTTLTLTSEPTSTAARVSSQGRSWTRGCDLMLYSQGHGLCNVPQEPHAVPATLTGRAGNMLSADAFGEVPSGRLAGGFVEWQREDGLVDRRSIDLHSGTTITVDYGAADLLEGLELTAYPGCAQTWNDCEYYQNTDNYGGELWIPGRNYYDGNPLD